MIGVNDELKLVAVDGESMTGRVVSWDVDRARGRDRREITIRVETITEAPAAPDGPWTLTADDLKEIEDNFGCTAQEGWEVDEDVLEKLRAIVDRPMVAAALAREGWRPRLGWVERLLRGALADHELATDAPHVFRRGEVADLEAALVEVRSMIDGDSAKGRAQPWQRKLAMLEARLIEWRPVVLPGFTFVPPADYWTGLDEIVAELRALIDA